VVVTDVGVAMWASRRKLHLGHASPEPDAFVPLEGRQSDAWLEKIADASMDTWSYGVCVMLLATRRGDNLDYWESGASITEIDTLAARGDLSQHLSELMEQPAVWGPGLCARHVVALVGVISGTLHRAPGSRIKPTDVIKVLQRGAYISESLTQSPPFSDHTPLTRRAGLTRAAEGRVQEPTGYAGREPPRHARRAHQP
jgi:hypothetical protein